jgi:U3 small nucleolar RNA-associated protein 4
VDEDEGKGSTTSRLFSSGLDGALLEWDVERRQAGPAADSMGGAVWQLAAEPGACIKPGARRVPAAAQRAETPAPAAACLPRCQAQRC